MAISGTLVLDSVNAFLNFCPRDNFGKGTSMYYVIKILGFLTPPPPPFAITFSTERNQKLPFSDPPPSPLCDYVIHGCSPSKQEKN